jgi:hypothetical protein
MGRGIRGGGRRMRRPYKRRWIIRRDEACLVRLVFRNVDSIMNHDDAVNVIRHNNKSVQFDIREMVRDFVPHPIRDCAQRRQPHLPIDDLAEQPFASVGADRDKIRARLRIIVIAQAWRFARRRDDTWVVPYDPSPYPPINSRRTIFAPSTIAFSFAFVAQRAVWLKPQSGVTLSLSAATYLSAVRMRSATSSAVSQK